jgi:3-methyladenine DNA glycosylase Tag
MVLFQSFTPRTHDERWVFEIKDSDAEFRIYVLTINAPGLAFSVAFVVRTPVLFVKP